MLVGMSAQRPELWSYGGGKSRMKTLIDTTGYLLKDKDGEQVVFIGTKKEMEEYRIWYARANQQKKPEIMDSNIFIVTVDSTS